jgi:hypothetical protein
MTAATVLFLVLRIAHVLLAALWLGMACFISFFLLPSLHDTGAAAGPVMSALMRRKLHIWMASLGGTVVLTGFYLYWRFTGGFDPGLSATRAAMVLGSGGIAGTLALIIGGAVVSRAAKKMAALGAGLSSMPEGQARTTAIAEMGAAHQRATSAGRLVVVLQAIALAAMAIAHYL